MKPLGPFTTAAGPAATPRPSDPRRIDTLVFRNEVAFTAFYDGHTLALDYDRKRLRAKAEAVERAFRAAVPEDVAASTPERRST